MATHQTTSDSPAAIARIKNVTTDSFSAQLQGEEIRRWRNGEQEHIGWIAWTPGIGEMGERQYEVANSEAQNFNQKPKHWLFTQPFGDRPALIAGMQTTNGGDTATVRQVGMDLLGVTLRIDEERSKDAEVKHANERVGYIALEALSLIHI